jgi:Flp pilus assembly protein TadD
VIAMSIEVPVATVSTDSRAIEAIYAIGHALLEQARATEAAKVFRVMLRLVPTDERSWLGLGACHEELDELEIAADLYGAGWTIAQPASASCLSALSRLLRAMGDTALADEYSAESIALANNALLEVGVYR